MAKILHEPTVLWHNWLHLTMLRDFVVVKICGFIGIVYAELACIMFFYYTIVIAVSVLFFSLGLIVH
jgi:hypothetical protein